MERVATIATAVSLAVIVVTLSVVVGFKQDLGMLISSSISDVVVTAPQSHGVVSGVGVGRNDLIESIFVDERVERVSPFTTKEGVIKSQDNIVGVLLKGVDTLYNTDFFEQRMLEGSFPRLGREPRSKDIMLSERVAKRMDVVVGDRIEMLFVDHKGTILRDKFELSGIYSTGVDFLDEVYAFTDMRNVARLYDGDSEVVTGYELWLEDGADPTLYKEELNDRFVTLYFDEGIDVEAFTIEDIFPDVFGWLATHDVTAILVVIIMLVVALLNMATALLIIVLERETMIGILRALGMGRKAVLRIFLYRSLFIVLRGVLWGAIIGFVVVLVQHLWRVIPLPTEGYLLDAVPTAMCWGWWCLAIVGSIVVTLLCMLLPATFATRISPVEIMRYE